MTLQEFKNSLENRNELSFIIENGIKIPAYFHITEMGIKTKHFMDCGGVMRKNSKITFQLWTSDDYEHRLSCYKLSAIIKKAESLIKEDLEKILSNILKSKYILICFQEKFENINNLKYFDNLKFELSKKFKIIIKKNKFYKGNIFSRQNHYFFIGKKL